MINYSIYPPIVSTYMPAFVLGESVRIYFSISAYMTIEQIKRDMVQVVINSQSTNSSVLKDGEKSIDYLFTSIKQDEQKGYYVEINSDNLNITNNMFYKAQLRFVAADADFTVQTFNEQAHKNFLSEWSTVCLLKPISAPDLNIQRFIGVDIYKTAIITTPSLKVVGSLFFKDSSEEETLYSYKVSLFEEEDINAATASENSKKILESELLYTNVYNPNQLDYQLNYNLMDNYKYLLRIEYTTSSGYEGVKDYFFSSLQVILDPIKNGSISATNIYEQGKIEVSITQAEDSTFKGVLVLRRTSSESNFTYWEDIQYFYFEEDTRLNLLYNDYLVKHGVFYRYEVLAQDEYDNRGTPLEMIEEVVSSDEAEEEPTKRYKPILCTFDDIFLTGSATEQLKIKFNPNINSFKHTVVESKTDTLGSKYPFIRRNGDTKYREFPISGLITHFCEESLDNEDFYLNITEDSVREEQILPNDFLKQKRKKYIAKGNEDLDNIYNDEYYAKNQNINGYNDLLLEREYREKILEYLYNNSVRLFRSPTEGNILIKLMNISLTPNVTLGRMIYSFSATAYEVDEYNFDNCIKYNIHSLNKAIIEDTKVSYYSKLGQQRITSYDYDKDKKYIDISQLIEKRFNLSETAYITEVLDYSWVRFDFSDQTNPYELSAPLLIDTTTFEILSKPNEHCIAGYLIEIDDVKIIVPQNGFYELSDLDTKVHSIKVYGHPDKRSIPNVSVDFLASMKMTPRRISLTTIYRHYIVGQLHNTDLKDIDIIDTIVTKYNNTTTTSKLGFKREVLDVVYLSIEGRPGLQINIQDAADSQPYPHMLNYTGVLTLYDKNTSFKKVTIEQGTANNEDENALKDVLIDYCILVEEGTYQ